MINLILKHLKEYFPTVYENMELYEYDGAYGLTITLNDGRKLFYNEAGNTIRKLPYDKDLMSEEEYRIEFGHQLRTMMLLRGVNQLTLSEMTGIAQPQLSGYLNGKNTASSYIVRKIARALDCSIDDLMYM